MSEEMHDLFTELVQKCVERLGKKKLWKLIRALREIPTPASPCVVRDQLRDLGVFVSDDMFTDIVSTYCVTEEQQVFKVDKFILDFFTHTLSPRRRYVLSLIFLKLGIDDANMKEYVSFESVLNNYSVHRHPAVVNGQCAPDDVVAELLSDFDIYDETSTTTSGTSSNPCTNACNERNTGNNDFYISGEELLAYYVGISSKTVSDSEFELRCIRSFALDTPKGAEAEHGASELVRMQGSRAMSRKSHLLGMKKVHPLYCTTNSDYGKAVTDKAAELPNLYKLPEHGRSQHFTRNLPPRKGGATSMNT